MSDPIKFPPAPTWADPVIVENNPATGQTTSKFNPQWLKWFLDVTGLMTSGGGGSGQLGDVRGPATAVVNGHIVDFDGIDGKLIKDGGIISATIVTGPASAVSGNIAVFDGVTGKKIKDGGGPSAANFIDAETPAGTINGVNDTFTLANTPSPAASLFLFHADGSPYIGGGVHYTLVADTITFDALAIPQTGDLLRANYRY